MEAPDHFHRILVVAEAITNAARRKLGGWEVAWQQRNIEMVQ